jgi:hypothetical protein
VKKALSTADTSISMGDSGKITVKFVASGSVSYDIKDTSILRASWSGKWSNHKTTLNFTGLSTGSTIVTISNDFNSEKIKIKVTVDMTKEVTGVSLNKSSATLSIGDDDLALTATITPSNATNKNLTWTSSNTKVATVSKYGKVTPVSAGNAVITVTTEDGQYTAECSITVTSPVTITMPSVPQDFTNYTSSTAKTIKQKYTLSNVYYEVKASYDGTYTVYLYFDGQKTYDYRGSGNSSTVSIGWKLYKDGIVVDSGTAYSQSIAEGEKFAGAKDYVWNLSEGEYELKILSAY